MIAARRRYKPVCASLLSTLLVVSACATPKHSQAKLLRLARAADASYQAGAFSAAKRQYEVLLEANPRYATAQVRLGVIAHREGDLDAATRRFEEALRTDAKNDLAAYNLAMLSLNQASHYLEQYVAIVPAPRRHERVLLLLEQLKAFQRN